LGVASNYQDNPFPIFFLLPCFSFLSPGAQHISGLGNFSWRILTPSCSEQVRSPYLCRWPGPAPRPSLQPLELRASVILLLCEEASPLQRGGKPASEQPWTKGLRCPFKPQVPRFEIGDKSYTVFAVFNLSPAWQCPLTSTPPPTLHSLCSSLPLHAPPPLSVSRLCCWEVFLSHA
jgi:hypothetical protein